MTLEVSTAILISVISLSFSVYMGLKSNKRTDTKDIEARAGERAEINVKLNHIASVTQEIKDQISSLVRDVQRHGDRITKVEESAKSAHHRLDTLEERFNEREERINE